jgi:hypothetical protein
LRHWLVLTPSSRHSPDSRSPATTLIRVAASIRHRPASSAQASVVRSRGGSTGIDRRIIASSPSTEVVARTPMRGSSQRDEERVAALTCPLGTFSPVKATANPARSSSTGSSRAISGLLESRPASP